MPTASQPSQASLPLQAAEAAQQIEANYAPAAFQTTHPTAALLLNESSAPRPFVSASAVRSFLAAAGASTLCVLSLYWVVAKKSAEASDVQLNALRQLRRTSADSFLSRDAADATSNSTPPPQFVAPSSFAALTQVYRESTGRVASEHPFPPVAEPQAETRVPPDSQSHRGGMLLHEEFRQRAGTMWNRLIDALEQFTCDTDVYFRQRELDGVHRAAKVHFEQQGLAVLKISPSMPTSA